MTRARRAIRWLAVPLGGALLRALVIQLDAALTNAQRTTVENLAEIPQPEEWALHIELNERERAWAAQTG